MELGVNPASAPNRPAGARSSSVASGYEAFLITTPGERTAPARTAGIGASAETIALLGLTLQWPWSRLVPAGVREEIRSYNLGHKGIC